MACKSLQICSVGVCIGRSVCRGEINGGKPLLVKVGKGCEKWERRECVFASQKVPRTKQAKGKQKGTSIVRTIFIRTKVSFKDFCFIFKGKKINCLCSELNKETYVCASAFFMYNVLVVLMSMSRCLVDCLLVDLRFC